MHALGKRIAFGALLLALGASQVSAEEVLKIGGIGTLSGGGTAWGLAIKRGAELAIDEVNKAGGLKVAGQTYKIEFIMYDDQYTGQGGKTAAERLVFQDKVKFIIGPIGSNPVLSTIEITTPEKVLVLGDGYTPAILKNEAHAPYNFRFTLTNLEFTPKMVKWVKENLHPKKVGILEPNDAIGQAVAPNLIKAYKEVGIDVWSDFFERGTKEFTPLLTRMIASDVDALDLNFNAPGDSGLMLKQAREAGFSGLVYQMGGPSVPENIEIAGKSAEGFISYEMYDFTSPVGKALTEEYDAKYGKGIINSQLPAFYNATKILFEALRRAGTVTDTTKVRDTIEHMDGYDAGVYGPLKWTGMETYGVNHQIDLPFFIVKVQDGKTVPLAEIKP
ncbi:MAG: ABC transporter substrate-binding protein [Alphaproteobacteria bacterium]